MIWKKLVLEGIKVVPSERIKELAVRTGKDEVRSVRYLQEHGYIYRILKGIFYIKGPEEIESRSFKYSIYEMVSEALRLKGVKNWYFGLETALKMNQMTHEYFTVNYVITDSFRTTKLIGILDSKFMFMKWSSRGDTDQWRKKVITGNACSIYWSNKEKTVLDLSYKNYIDGKGRKQIIAPPLEYGDQLECTRLSSYLSTYPPKFQEMVGFGGLPHGVEGSMHCKAQ